MSNDPSHTFTAVSEAGLKAGSYVVASLHILMCIFPDESDLQELPHCVGGSESRLLDCWTSTYNSQSGPEPYMPALTHHHEQLS